MLEKRAALRQIVSAIGRSTILDTKQLKSRIAARTSPTTALSRSQAHGHRALHTGRTSAHQQHHNAQHEAIPTDLGGSEKQLDDILMWTLQNAVSEVTRTAVVTWPNHGVAKDGWGISVGKGSGNSGASQDSDDTSLHLQASSHEPIGAEGYSSSDHAHIASPVSESSPESRALNRLRSQLGNSTAHRTATDESNPEPRPTNASEEHQAYVAELQALLSNAKSLEEKESLTDRLRWATLNYDTAESSAASWRLCFTFMQKISPDSPTYYVKQLETITLPAGKRITWTSDPYSIVDELYHRTDCELGVPRTSRGAQRPRDLPSAFSAFTLYGTEEQIASAKRYIIASGHFVVQDTDAEQQLPVSQPVLHALQDGTDFWHVSHSEKARNTPGQAFRAGARWRAHRKDRPIKELLTTAFGDTDLSALQLTRLVESLVRYHKGNETRDLRATAQVNPARTIQLLERALRAILTRPSNVQVTTKTTIRKAFGLLSYLRRYGTMRQIIAAHDQLAATANRSIVSAIDTTAYNCILRSSVQASDVAMFSSALKDMSRRKLAANGLTWALFHDLTARCRPSEIHAVESKMQELGVLQDEFALNEFLGNSIPRRLEQSLHARDVNQSPDTYFVNDFLKREVGAYVDLPDWLTTQRAWSLVDILLANNLWSEAYQILEQMHPWHIRASLLRHYIDAAMEENTSGAERCVEILKHFEARLAQSPRHLAAFYSYGFTSYETLFRCAFNSRSWNLLRVIWHHACRAGEVTTWMRHKMKHGFRMAPYRDRGRRISDELEIWNKNYARFAMDMPASGNSVKGNWELMDHSIREAPEQHFANTPGFDAIRAWEVDCKLRVLEVWPSSDDAEPKTTMERIELESYRVRTRDSDVVRRV